MTDLELMQSIKTQWGDAIAAAADASSVPPALLAALIANESGGDANAKRFESHVLLSLWEVLLGRKAAYGSIRSADLVSYVSGLTGTPVNLSNLPSDAFQRVDALATSWGITQIMGYQAFDFQVALPDATDVNWRFTWIGGLRDGEKALKATTRILAQFAARFQMSFAGDDEGFFRCWNTGKPDGQTFDPNYALVGMTRMAIWTSL